MQTIITETETPTAYAADLTVQLKKGMLTQCVLLVATTPKYASEIIAELEKSNLDIVEGTIYPLLSRLSRDGLLSHEWQESPSGPPRKYYQITDYGKAVRAQLSISIAKLNHIINNLERKPHE
jgi:PadR family transcriptional regulator PadR